MTLYHFVCPSCGSKQENEQSIKSDLVYPKCECGTEMKQQLFSPILNLDGIRQG